jgi:uracil-DNA glycosylase
MLEGIGMAREDVFICNVLKCRPPGNRDPQPAEIEACEPYLAEQVRLIEPRVVCTLGNFATKLLTQSQTGITRVRGVPQVHELGGRSVFVMPLFHPAAALRTPAVAEQLRGDFERLPELLKQPLPQPVADPGTPGREAQEVPGIGSRGSEAEDVSRINSEPELSAQAADQLDLLD